jgi:hypothetical protein
MSSEVNAHQRATVAERAYHVCEYCLLHEDDTYWGCQIDHIISQPLLQLHQDSRLRERATLGHTGRYPAIEALARMKE